MIDLSDMKSLARDDLALFVRLTAQKPDQATIQ